MRKGEVPQISTLTLRFFRVIVRRYFRRHFRAVLAQHVERMQSLSGEDACPLIIYANHGSWWDPMISVLLADLLLPARNHFAPMDAKPLARYPILRKVGIFPIDLETARGAAQFLRTSEEVLRGGGVLWVTPQGRFADARERPLNFKSGLAALARRVPDATLLPLAIEYTFWNERLPEALLRFGEPLLASDVEASELETALERTMDDLRGETILRDPLHFTMLLEGGRGTGGFYALGKRVRAVLRGGKFEEDHSARDARASAGTHATVAAGPSKSDGASS